MNKRTEKIEIIKNFDSTNISKKFTKTVLFVQYLGMNIACRCVNKLVAYQYSITVHITQAMQS